MYLERVPEDRERAIRYLEVIPANAIVEEHFEVLFELLERHSLLDRVQPIFERHADAAWKRLSTLLTQGRVAAASVWLTAVPQSHRDTVLDHLRKQVELHGPSYASFDLCRSWLVQWCASRAPGWRDAYPVLEEFERRLKRVTQIFGASERPLTHDNDA